MADLTTALMARLLAAPTLQPIVASAIHWGIVPQGKPLPYIRLQVVSDPRPEHLKGYDGTRQVRVQADCFARTYAQARAIAEAVIADTAEPATVGGVIFGRTKAEGPRDLGEDTPAGFVHRLSVDLLVEHRIA